MASDKSSDDNSASSNVRASSTSKEAIVEKAGSNRPSGSEQAISPFAKVFLEGLKEAGVSIVAALPESLPRQGP